MLQSQIHLIKTTCLTSCGSFRTFSSLNTSKRGCLQKLYPNNMNFQHCDRRKLSTLESMYMKVVSLPIVHHIEDTFAFIHDLSG